MLDMSWISEVPEWIGTAILGAAFAAIGYAVRLIQNYWRRIRTARAVNLASFM